MKLSKKKVLSLKLHGCETSANAMRKNKTENVEDNMRENMLAMQKLSECTYAP